VMAVYLLFRIEKKLDALTGAITGLQLTLGQSAPGERCSLPAPLVEGGH